jgi:hypothetical protein
MMRVRFRRNQPLCAWLLVKTPASALIATGVHGTQLGQVYPWITQLANARLRWQ